MLPKPDKNKKNNTDTVDQATSLSPQEKVNLKRRLIIIIIFLTIGISIIFVFYRFITNTHLSFPKISPPSFKFNNSQLEIDLKKLIGSDFNQWKFIAQSAQTNYFWSSDSNSSPVDLPKVVSLIESQHQEQNPNIKSVLPDGIKFIQLCEESRCQIVIVTPQDQFLVDIQNSTDVSKFNSRLPQIVSTIYWGLVRQ